MNLPVVPYGVTNVSGLIEWLRTLAASIAVGWGQEHNSDGTHGVIHERGRTMAMGEWISVPFNAANFTGNGAMAWTVDISDVTTFAYTRMGTTMIVSWYLVATTVGGTPAQFLQITLPEGVTAVKAMSSMHEYGDNGVRGNGQADVLAGTSVIRLIKADASAWTASANNTSSVGQIILEVQ